MLPKYKCPTCAQEFSRKWNMRAHCKGQHDYDPIPSKNPKKYGFSNDSEVDSNYYEAENAIGRVVTMMEDLLKIQQLGRANSITGRVRSDESYLNNLVDDYIIISKRDISGVSGYLCNRCLSFQFRYVMDIGRNLTAREKHRCDPEEVKISNTLGNTKQPCGDLVAKATDCLVTLTNSLFHGRVDVKLISNLSGFVNYNAPLIKLDNMDFESWLPKLIQKSKIRLTDSGLRKYITRMKLTGTYVKFLVNDVPYSGKYLMYLKRRTALPNEIISDDIQ